jgi:Na+/H+ antiporter
MTEAQSVLLAIAVAFASVLLSALGRRLPIPTAILQVFGGLILGLVPGAEALRVSPDLVFFVFLPPVLWAAAFFTSFRDFKANLRPIGLLAIGLVAVTTIAVAVLARHLLPDLPWPAAVALGAIVSPPDAVAAEAILKRLSIPHRLISVLLGESLVNDASALILYRGAVAALVTGAFSPGELVVRFFVDALLGILLGLMVGWLIIRAAERTDDPLAETVLTLLGPYLAWIAGEYLHVSAVLACVAGGIYVRRHFSTIVAPASRIQGRAVWDLFLFGLNSLVFLLLGAEFGNLLRSVPGETLLHVGRSGVLIAGLVILVRLCWVPLAAVVPRWLSPSLRARDPLPGPASLFIVAWTGMRGMVSLAAALALPLRTVDGSPTPFRAQIVLITVVVILVTLVLQGLTLIPLFKRLPLPRDGSLLLEEAHARAEARRAALEHLADLSQEPWVTPEALARAESDINLGLPPAENADAEVTLGKVVRRVRMTTLGAQRLALVRLRDEEAISDEVLLLLESELDYEALRLGFGADRDR